MLLLVSYDLKVPGRDYTKLYETLKSANSWWHYLESTWILYTTQTSVNDWNDKIRTAMDTNDSLFVVDITGKNRNGWLKQKAWDWLKEHDR